MYKRSSQGFLKHLDFAVLDMLCLLLSLWAAFCLRHHRMVNLRKDDLYLTLALVMMIVDVGVIAVFNTMHAVMRRKLGGELVATMKHAVLVFVVTLAYLFTVKNTDDHSRVVLYITLGMHCVTGFLTRIGWKRVAAKIAAKSKGAKRSVLLVTEKDRAAQVIANLRGGMEDALTLGGVILVDGEGEKEISGLAVRGGLEDGTQYICRNWVDEVFIDVELRTAEVRTFMDHCRRMGVTIHEVLGIESRVGNQQFVEKMGNYQVVTSTVVVGTPLQVACKRLIDICAGLVGIVATGIIVLIVGPKIKKASPGPIFFTQDRVGQNGRIFKFVKIRSMYLDAEARKKDLMSQNTMKGGMFKVDFDPRIIGNEVLPDGTRKTGIGQFIRDTSLDEFPQFWNVLKGDMSLVGTRPPTVDEWEQYELHHRARLAMKPGITGKWQASGRSNIKDFEEVVAMDTEYIYNWSLKEDIIIILKTFKAVLKKEGAQ